MEYLDKWTGKPRKVFFTSYLLDVVFPTFCRSVSSELRTAVRDFVLCCHDLRSLTGDSTILFDKYCQVVDTFRGKLFMPICDYVLHTGLDVFQLKSRCEECFDVIAKWFDYPFDWLLYRELDKKRKIFLEKCFSSKEPVFIDVVSFKARKSFQLARAREVL